MNKSSAYKASEFCHTLQLDKDDRVKSVSVPGHEGKSYRVILRRNGAISGEYNRAITTECHLTTSNGDIPCKGNPDSICYH